MKKTKMPKDYTSFLQSKIKVAPKQGFDCSIDEINPRLKPHNKLMVKWMVEGGRRACFASFGLHKTVTQLEVIRITLSKIGTGRGLIICPLSVRQEFVEDSKNILGWETPPKFIRRIEEAGESGIYMTNYESVRDGKLDPREFETASLDEASILRGLGGTKTFREFMRLFTGDAGPMQCRRGEDMVKFRYVATATPSPNDYIELLAYADFLGVMDVSQAKTRFFKRDSTQADKLTLHVHKEEEFWLWVSSWALFVTKPSDITGDELDNEGYILPALDVRWHEISTNHENAGTEKDGQIKMFKDTALGLEQSAREKRESLSGRIEKMMELRKEIPFDIPEINTLENEIIHGYFRHTANYSNLKALKSGESWGELHRHSGSSTPVFWSTVLKGIKYTDPESKKDKLIPLKQILSRVDDYKPVHRVIWHDLEDERKAIEQSIPSVKSIFGKQDYEIREEIIKNFSYGEITELAAKPVIAGSGCNFQRYCSWAIYLGIGYKFNDFIQSVHRLQRFLQTKPVRIDLIYTEAERNVRKTLEQKWQNHIKLVNNMVEIIKKYGLSHAEMAQHLTRKIGVERIEVSGNSFTMVNNDNIVELDKKSNPSALDDNSVGLALTSIPFSTQYEYSPNYADFGHSESNEEFFQQMDFLTPNVFRVLQPGRLCVVHVKDRIVPMGLSGMGCQEVYPFHLDTILHYKKHGFAYMGMKTIVTDVVRENNQTYRLGWTEQCKDGSKMGVGMPEYLLIFRKPQSDLTNAYADIPVYKAKKEWVKSLGEWKNEGGYSRARWQMDAAGFTRSSGNRCLKPEELVNLDPDKIFKEFREYSKSEVWDFEHVVKIAETLELKGKLPSGFMLLQPQSWSDEVWTDITRMLTLNGSQWSKGKEMHLCPMQFDIADRVIEQMSNPGDIVLDYFSGLGTVPYRAVLKGRKGYGIELNPTYFLDSIGYCKSAEEKLSVPTLFDSIPDEV